MSMLLYVHLKNDVFPNSLPFHLYPMSLPILTVSQLHAKSYDVCAMTDLKKTRPILLLVKRSWATSA